MRDINMRELERYETVKYVATNSKANRKRACLKLGISNRHLRRLIVAYNTKGKDGFVHGNTQHVPWNRIDAKVKKDVVEKWENKYYCCNNTHYSEKLLDHENITVSNETVRRILLSSGIASKRTHKNTKQRLKNLTKMASDFMVNDIIYHALSSHEPCIAKDNQHCRIAPPENFGEEVQMDASQEIWFGDKKAMLHLAIDRKQGLFLSGYFYPQETLTGYVWTIIPLLQKYGKPKRIVTDNRGVFTNLGVDESERNVKLTQFGYACQILGIELVTTSIAQRKGGVERANQTAQDRVVAELMLHKVKTIEEANKILPNILDELNRKLGKKIDNRKSLYEPLQSNEDLLQIFSYKCERTTDCGNCIKYKNQYWQLYDDGKLINVGKFVKCMVMEYIDGRVFVSIYNRIYLAQPGLCHYKDGKLVHPKGITTVSRYKPPMSHPYKLASFLEYTSRVKIRNVFYNEIQE